MEHDSKELGQCLDDWYVRMQMFRMWMGISIIGTVAVGCVMVL